MRYILILLLWSTVGYGQKATVYGEVGKRTADSIELNFPNSIYYDRGLSMWAKVRSDGVFSFAGNGDPSCMAVLRYDGREQEIFIYPGEEVAVRLMPADGSKLVCTFYGPGAAANIFILNELKFDFTVDAVRAYRWTLDTINLVVGTLKEHLLEASHFLRDSVKLPQPYKDKLVTEGWYHSKLIFINLFRRYFKERGDMVGKGKWEYVRRMLLSTDIPTEDELQGSITAKYWMKEYERIKAESDVVK